MFCERNFLTPLISEFLYLSKMQAFLQIIAESVSKENLPYLYKRCYIFPTKRAAIYFTNFLKEKFKEENFILPQTITIQDFLQANTSFIIKDDWYLLMELHEVQTALTQQHQPFEKFLPWGKLILRDFDECDKYLVDAQQLFSILKTQKEIDTTFSISDEIRKYIEQFILTKSSHNKENIYKEHFIKTWHLLGDMYVQFKQQLASKNFAYEGMAYREVLENVQNGKLKLPYSEIIFCGFNALSVCEETLFKTIEQQYTTSFWWDADAHFMQNKFHEAGNFLRAYQTSFSGENNHWILDKESASKKNIHITGVSSDIGQAQFVANTINLDDTQKTAVVLCDEQLLSPLLYTIDVSKVNITMGYTLAHHPLYLLVELLLNFFGNTRISENGNVAYYHKDIAALAEHFYFKNKIQALQELQHKLPFFVPFMAQDVLQQYFPKAILSSPTTATDILNTIIEFIHSLQVNDVYFKPAKALLIDELGLLLQSFKDKNIQVDRSALLFITKQFLGASKIPFETNTLNNTQIMGFLETRILDFDTLYILSMNDDKLPGTNKTNSFIPYNLRVLFKLPTFEQFDGINAYHFYRLLKRATTIHLVYNNQIGDNASEMSRFIRQIQHEFDTTANVIHEQIATFENSVTPTIVAPIQIAKTPEMSAALQLRKFSATALKTYIKCPLQFYLKYIEHIEEPSELDEDIDAAVFGQIMHKVLENIYAPFLNTILSKEKLQSFTENDFIHQAIKNACTDLALPKEIWSGSNNLQLSVIERLVQKIILNDAKEEQLQVKNVEETIFWDTLLLHNGTFAKLQGTIDRVDVLPNDAIRIVDYKSGKINLPKFPDLDNENKVEAFMDMLFVLNKTDYSAAFQGMLYALMYYKLFNCHTIYVAFHQARNMRNGMSYLNDGEPIPIELLRIFEKRLSKLISELIYENPYFIQSENELAYQYGVYGDLLGIK